MKLTVLKDVCADIIIGHDVLEQHSKVKVNFGGPKSALTICCMSHAKLEPPNLFAKFTLRLQAHSYNIPAALTRKCTIYISRNGERYFKKVSLKKVDHLGVHKF